VNTSVVVRFFEFIIFRRQRTTGWVALKRNQSQRSVNPSHFKTLKEPTFLKKEHPTIIIKSAVSGQFHFSKTVENRGSINIQEPTGSLIT